MNDAQENAETARPTVASRTMLQANSCKLLARLGVAKPRDRIGDYRIIGLRQTSRNTLQQFSSPISSAPASIVLSLFS
jgi:hypothetical protein